MRRFKTKPFARFAAKQGIAVDRQELRAFRLLAAQMLAMDGKAIKAAVKNGTIMEIDGNG
ncbi:hypothetical protein D3C83_119710 [compost metagenome]